MEDLRVIDQGFQQKEGVRKLPGDNSMLLLAIASLIFVFGILGLVIARNVLLKSSEALAIYAENPHLYSISSLKKVKAARTVAIAGIILFAAIIVVILSINA